ncbi:MAG: OmpA family protein [Planctomycetes bacterium]|nr:OmpA family protein [Planctomycetota bacterium]
MNTYRLLVACVVAVASLNLIGCGDARTVNYRDVEIEEYQRQIKDLEEKLAAKDAATIHDTLTRTEGNSGKQVAAIQEHLPGVGWGERNKEIVFTIENSILFKAGSSDLSLTAKSTLNKVVALINEKYKNNYIRVEGFTDDQPIRRTKDKWDDNWDLSGGRAQSVLHYLLERHIPAADLGFAGYGQERAVASGSGEAARAKNRRVEIIVIPK